MLPVSQARQTSVCGVRGPHAGSLLWVAWLSVSQGLLPSEPHRAQDVRECHHFATVASVCTWCALDKVAVRGPLLQPGLGTGLKSSLGWS